MEKVRVTLQSESVSWIEQFGNAGGARLLEDVMGRLIDTLERMRAGDPRCSEIPEEKIISALYDAVQGARSFINAWPGIKATFKTDSKLSPPLAPPPPPQLPGGGSDEEDRVERSKQFKKYR
uniref:Uncharacterized protein n=1 Tax=Steinernema glaseri TaxID=37863 RepID=A0A1I8ALC1_9BILA